MLFPPAMRNPLARIPQREDPEGGPLRGPRRFANGGFWHPSAIGAVSSAGRAPALHAGGREFEPLTAHSLRARRLEAADVGGRIAATLCVDGPDRADPAVLALGVRTGSRSLGKEDDGRERGGAERKHALLPSVTTPRPHQPHNEVGGWIATGDRL